MYFLYKITNTVNGKLYIGITLNPDKRWETHLLAAQSSDKPLYQAIRKHGVNSFNMEVICSDIKSEQEALLIEAEYIRKLDTLVINGKGYNILALSGGRQIVDGKFLCGKCGIEKDISAFYKSKAAVSGLSTWCKECCKKSDTERYYEKRDSILEQKKDYFIRNKTSIDLYRRAWLQNNKEHVLKRRKNYYDNNRDDLLAEKKEYYSQKREDILLKKREYYLKNKEAIQARRKLKKASKNESSSGSPNN